MIHSSKVPFDVPKVSHLQNDRDLTSWEGFVLEKQSMAVTEPATCTAMQLRVAPIAQANPITQ